MDEWSVGRIIERIQLWEKVHGSPPKGNDWRLAGNDEHGAWPSEATVKGKFGTWSSAIALAGFKPRGPGRPASSSVVPTFNIPPLSNTVASPNTVLSAAWNYSPTPSWGDQGAQKKLDVLKAVLELDPKTNSEVLLAIINA